MRARFLLLLLGALAPGAASAQGALGVQGYGYPAGQLSTAALGVGGATAEVDPSSPVNPANLGRATRYSVYLQFDPEYRRTSVNGASTYSSTFRFPNFLVSGALGRFTVGASTTTLLDRTWLNSYADTVLVDGRPEPSTLVAGSNGAMNDTRFAASYWVNQRLQVGLGVHAISGENRVELGRFFDDSSTLGDVSQASVINFSGSAFSFGVVGAPTSTILIGASVKLGNALRAEQADEPLAEARVPSRYGISAAYYGIPNTTLSARLERTAWTRMRDLGSSAMSVFDATEFGMGVDVVGPRFAGAFTTGRLGWRDRTLPFGVGTSQVRERGLTGGFAIPVAQGRGQIDLGLQRAVRRAAGATEKAWMVSIGLGVRP